MTKIIISGESHCSEEDLKKHEALYRDAQAVFIETLTSEENTKGQGVLYPLYVLGGLLYGLFLQVMMLLSGRTNVHTPAYQKYNARVYLAIDKSVAEIYNDTEKRMKALSFTTICLLLALNILIIYAVYDLVYYMSIFALLILLGVSIRRRMIISSAFISATVLYMTCASFWPAHFKSIIQVHKAIYTLLLLGIATPWTYFIVLSASVSATRQRENRMAERIDAIIKEKGYEKALVLCGQAHVENLKNLLESRGHTVETISTLSGMDTFKERGILKESALNFICSSVFLTVISLVLAILVILTDYAYGSMDPEARI